jgi:hypothetical protein
VSVRVCMRVIRVVTLFSYTYINMHMCVLIQICTDSLAHTHTHITRIQSDNRRLSSSGYSSLRGGMGSDVLPMPILARQPAITRDASSIGRCVCVRVIYVVWCVKIYGSTLLIHTFSQTGSMYHSNLCRTHPQSPTSNATSTAIG